MADRHPRAGRLVMRITWARIALVPVVMVLVLAGDDAAHAYVAAAVIFGVAAVTDLVDGYLARRWEQTTTFGSFLDTTADKVLVAGTLVALVSVARASPWWTAVIVVRELAVLGLRGVVATTGEVVRPSVWGKLKANVQFVAIVAAIVRTPTRWGPWHPDEWLMAVAGVVTIASAYEYFSRFSRVLSPSGPPGEPDETEEMISPGEGR